MNQYSIDLSTTNFTIKINTDSKYGFFEHVKYGDEYGGGLWFDLDMKLKDYDGVYFLPDDVRNQLRLNNLITKEFYEDTSSS